MREKREHTIIRTALVFAIVYVLVWGGIPAPALAEMVEGGTAPSVAAEAGASQGAATNDVGGSGDGEPKAVAETVSQKVAVPASASGLVYDGTEQVGVPEGEGFTLAGNTATDAGDYAATATLKDGYAWDDGSTDSKEISWSIARRPVTVTADGKTKTAGEADPELTATIDGLVGDDEVVFDISHEAGEEPGKYEITPSGDSEQGNYAVTFVSGKLAVGEAPKPALTAQADGDLIASGTWGTCPWEITSDGTLTVHPGVGASQRYRSTSPWSPYSDSITSVTLAAEDDNIVVLPAASGYLFGGLTNVTSMNLSNADTSNVADMSFMFSNCSSLKSIGGLPGWDTLCVTDTNGMFSRCGVLQRVDLSNWVTPVLTKTGGNGYHSGDGNVHYDGMFYGCSSLESVGDLSGWDTSNVTNMGSMFYGCSSLESVGDLSGWDTSKVQSMVEMFFGCKSITTLNLSNWNTSNVLGMRWMFHSCSSLSDLNLSNWDVSHAPNMGDSTFDSSLGYLFGGCGSLSSLNLEGWDTASFDLRLRTFFFRGCSQLTRIVVGDKFTLMEYMPDRTINGIDGWYSESLHRVLSKKEVSARNRIADVYSKGKPTGATDISNATVCISDDCEYDGIEKCPIPDVTLNGDSLSVDNDYWISYANNIERGNATAILHGWGDYTGTCEAQFVIHGARLSKAVLADIEPVFYTGEPCIPKLSIAYDGRELVKGTDYDLAYENNVNVGTATIRVMGKGSFEGERTASFEIKRAEIEIPTSIDPLPYDGKERVGVAAGEGYSVAGETVGINAGTYTVNVSPDSNHVWRDGSTEAKEIHWSITAKPVTVTADDKSKAFGENDPTFSATVEGTIGNDTLNYSLTREEGEALGEYVITPSGEVEQGNYTVSYLPGKLVIGKADSTAFVVSGVVEKPWTGSSITQSPTITAGGKVLQEGIDYDLTYENNVGVGTAKLIVTGKGNYTGSKVMEFEIVRAPIDVVMFDDLVYDGAEKVGVSQSQGYALSGTSVATNAGEYTAVVTPDANHAWPDGTTGAKELGWSIARRPVTVTADDKTKAYGEPNPALTATVKGLVGDDAVEYSLSREQGEALGEYAITPSGAAVQGNYAVTYVPGKLTIGAIDLARAQIDKIDRRIFDGTSIQPKPTVRIGDTVLAEGTDYELSYTSNVNVGTATVTVTGKGNYGGTKTADFEIGPRLVSVIAKNAFKERGAADPSFEAEVTGLVGEDRVSYSFARDPGELNGLYDIHVAGDEYQGNYRVLYTGALLRIASADLANATVSGVEDKTYTGSAIQQDVVVTAHGTTLRQGTDYRLEYENNVNAGQATVIVKRVGNDYVGEKRVTFSVLPKPVTVTADSKTKPAGVPDPELTAVVDGLIGNDQISYTLTRQQGESAGTYSITPMGETRQGNYTVTFVPGKLTIAAVKDSGSLGDGFTYKVTSDTLYVYGSGKLTSLPTYKGSWSVKNIVYGEGITSIDTGYTDYYYSSRVTSVSLPQTLTEIGEKAFRAYKLKNLTVPSAVTSIGVSAFESCTSLESVVFAEGSKLVTLGERAFYGDRSLESITLPGLLETIGADAFHSCSGLMAVETGSAIKAIGDKAFYDCGALTSVNLKGGNNASIGTRAFYDCPALETATIGEGYKSIGAYSFGGSYGGSDSLQTVMLASTIETIGPYAFRWKGNLKSLSLPANLKTIDDGAFEGCGSLSGLTLPSCLTTIGKEAFEDCPNAFGSSLVFPSSVRTIGDSAFACGSGAGRFAVSTMEFKGGAPEIAYNAFTGIKSARAIHPANNASWTDEKCVNYGGELTWYSRASNGAVTKDPYRNAYPKTYLSKSGSSAQVWIKKSNVVGGTHSFEINVPKKSRIKINIGCTAVYGNAGIKIIDNDGKTHKSLYTTSSSSAIATYFEFIAPSGTAHVEFNCLASDASSGQTIAMASVGYNILQSYDIAETNISSISPVSYNGKAQTPKPKVTINALTAERLQASTVNLREGTDYTLSYKNNVNIGTATVIITGKGNYVGTKSTTFKIAAPPTAPAAAHVAYRTHVQSFGWQPYVRDGAMSGTSGKAKRLEGINIKLEGAHLPGSIEYRTHVQKIGWQGYMRDGAMSGTSGRALRLEAIQIRLTGQMAERYDVWYRVHAQTYGWMGWAKNDSPAGTAGYAKRLEGIEIRVLPKGSAAPGSQSGAFVTKDGASPAQSYAGHQVSYRTHVQSFGWRSYVCDGQMSGTTGLAKRLEGINVKLINQQVPGSIEYRTHVQSYGWMPYVRDGAMSGTSGQAKRLEAIQIRLTGQMAQRFDVWYRVHAQTFGWMGWARNDQQAGTAGYAKRLECIEIVVLPKGSPAPGSTANAFRRR